MLGPASRRLLRRALTSPAQVAPPRWLSATPARGRSGKTKFPLLLKRHVLPSPVTRLLVALVWAYRLTLAPLLGGHCRFTPTCSQYALDALHKHGPWRGAWRAAKRVGRCHPWGGEGYDPA